MKYLLKNMIRPLYYYFKNPNEREFQRLYTKWGGVKRYERINNVKFLGFIFDIPDLQSFIWQFKEIFVDEIYKFNSNNKQPIIFDCGANVGTSCLYFKQLFPNAKIKAFEADPMIAEILKSNLSKNGISDVEIINKAVWIDDNGIEFGSEGADGGSINASNNKIKIESIRLKDFLDKEEVIDLLKIDIEGAEYEVLKDCRDSLANVQNIFVEYHSWNSSAQQLSEILSIFESNGFRYYIEDISKRKHPFVNHNRDTNMDLQLNIFGYKD
ncbi:FkbM family methyltransferase [Aliarcobacter cryaerophilus]|uniref:FkbM family methyltransferase n=1 Tax=Aliarcobacter cryaerophilus TaxID=28198 RepID=UPI0021B5D39E|nr:FkbM family methyltransferase [Aliarcobacter cryaerophilus]MCT7541249.1 FkbM family methyltransferase [Aliarcobacter cryaerophilus]